MSLSPAMDGSVHGLQIAAVDPVGIGEVRSAELVEAFAVAPPWHASQLAAKISLPFPVRAPIDLPASSWPESERHVGGDAENLASRSSMPV